MTDWWTQLRAPFPPELIGKLPKTTCRDCSQNKQQHHCAKHKMTRCQVCGSWITEAHIHVDFVGHAAVTDRILAVDPEYGFGPVLDVNKVPISRGPEMLHSLTIKGVTRVEWGEGPNMKECSSDGIRRCAMRFGVALDLWSKEDLHATPAGATETPILDAAADAAEVRRAHETKSTLDVSEPDRSVISGKQVTRLFAIARTEYKLSDPAIKAVIVGVTGQESSRQIKRYQYDQVMNELALASQAVPE